MSLTECAHRSRSRWEARVFVFCAGTCIVLHQLLYSVKLRPGGDVVASVVELADFIMLDVVPFVVVPVTDGQRVSTWEKRVTWTK